jgi:hypothetical protein
MAPSKQACKNNEKFSYSGKEMSPLGLGYCADAETVGSFMEGKDGKTWIVGVKNNEKVWIRAPENKQLEKEAPEIEAVDEEVKPEPDEEVKPKKKAAPKKKQAVEPEPVEATESDVDSEAAKPEPVEAAPEKSKRKYTKKTKQTEAEESEPAEPAPEKPKRKYTKKTKQADADSDDTEQPAPEKPTKRKYTKKTKPVTEGDEQIPAKPKTKRGPSGYNLYIGQKINEFRASEQGLKTTEYMKKAQDAWRALSKTEQEEISKELKEAAAQAAAVVEIDA